MGCCYSSPHDKDFELDKKNHKPILHHEYQSHMAIKFPHGKSGIELISNTFEPCNDINDWLTKLLFKSKNDIWTNYIIYNDETHLIMETPHHRRGHCKGILLWSNQHILWLCHSVPNFPDITFDGKKINLIRDSELIYGQSFHTTSLLYNDSIFEQIVNHISIMEANIYMDTRIVTTHPSKQHPECKIHTLVLVDNSFEKVTHLAKPPTWNFDIYEDFIAIEYAHTWVVETWIRGHRIPSNENVLIRVYDNDKINYRDEIIYKESQDHSKWAVALNTPYYFVGDLNRMTSQFKRGGGGILCSHPFIANELQKLVNPDMK